MTRAEVAAAWRKIVILNAHIAAAVEAGAPCEVLKASQRRLWRAVKPFVTGCAPYSAG